MSDLKPEKSATLELGTKWNVLDERLSLTAAIFQNDRRDAQIEVEPGQFAQAGHPRVRGLELGASGEVLPGWNIYGGYTYMNSKLGKGAHRGINEGSTFANTPKQTTTIW